MLTTSVEPAKSYIVCIYDHLLIFPPLYVGYLSMFPTRNGTGVGLYLPTLTMVVLQASQMEQVIVMLFVTVQ